MSERQSGLLWLFLTAFFLLAAGCAAERGKPTEANYNAVKDGMTKEQVEARLGPNNEVIKDVQFSQVIQQNPQAEWRRWKRPKKSSDYSRDENYYLVGFVNGKVVEKAPHTEKRD